MKGKRKGREVMKGEEEGKGRRGIEGEELVPVQPLPPVSES